jgi:rifampicin phosphotransferase
MATEATPTTEDFQVSWQDPADAALTWLHNPMHLPRPLSPTAGQFWERVYASFMNGRTIYVNGFAFISGLNPPPPTPEILQRGAFDVWTKDFQPIIQSTNERIRRGNYETVGLAELANSIEGILDEAVETFGYTMLVITGFMGPTFGLVQFLSEELGPEGPQLAASLLQGFENGTAAAGAGLSELTESAAARPAVADALRRGDHDSLDAVEGGAEFMLRFRDYLNTYGWRPESWGLIHLPTWAEEPQVPLMLVARYLIDPEHTPAAAIRRAIASREAAVTDIEARLSPEKLPHFRGILAAAQDHVPVSEGRSLWQLITIGSLRVPFMALGRKLVEAGALHTPDDVFFLLIDELRQAGTEPSESFANLASQRHAAHERWEHLSPPPFVGAPLDMSQLPPEMLPLLHLFFGAGMPEVEGQEIKGQAASKGIARGRARVIRRLSEAEKLQQGEILVCQTTAPPWTPLFAIAAGVVTDTGGVLSHSAICAREYAIPCVVATQIATRIIQDGALITVDGSRGVVRIEG